MVKGLDPVRTAFEKAVGPFRKRQKIMEELKGPEMGKSRRATLAKEAAKLETQWTQALIDLRKAMDQCPTLRPEKEE